MIYGSVCSGIEAATVAWEPLGWKPAWFAEIDKFPSAVLAHHYPHVPNRGDFTEIKDDRGTIDLLVGGTPCQSFSVAGKREGLDDPRGNLALEYLALLERLRPTWVVWENVPGVLSVDKGRAFGTFIGQVAKFGYGWAYRVMDAQYFGVPQRRRRVFLVGYLGDWRPPAAVLFERYGLSGHPPPSREAGQEATGTLSARTKGGGGLGTDFDCAGGVVAHCLAAHAAKGGDPTTDNYVVHAFAENQRGEVLCKSVCDSLKVGGGKPGQGYPATLQGKNVRRLTPRECERLQGFPDEYTLVPYRNKPAADGPRYKALGNSMAVPCMRWIGQRIDHVQWLLEGIKSAHSA